MSFSRRNGYEPEPVLQLDGMDEALRNALWTVVVLHIRGVERNSFDMVFYHSSTRSPYECKLDYLKDLWVHFWKQPIDTCLDPEFAQDQIRAWYYGLDWRKVYDFIEFLLAPPRGQTAITPEPVNAALQREHSAYTISAKRLVVPITDATQLEAINAATKQTSALTSVHEHLTNAQKLFSIREAPYQYGPSIGEAISAVETLAKMMVADVVGTLDGPNSFAGAAKLFPKAGIKLPSQLLDSWLDTWGYTCERAGIRHGKPHDKTGTEISQAEALYMLVKCSAFVSYLLQLASEANIKLGEPNA